MNRNGRLNTARLGTAAQAISSTPAPRKIGNASDLINVNRVNRGQPVTPGQVTAPGGPVAARGLAPKTPVAAPLGRLPMAVPRAPIAPLQRKPL